MCLGPTLRGGVYSKYTLYRWLYGLHIRSRKCNEGKVEKIVPHLYLSFQLED